MRGNEYSCIHVIGICVGVRFIDADEARADLGHHAARHLRTEETEGERSEALGFFSMLVNALGTRTSRPADGTRCTTTLISRHRLPSPALFSSKRSAAERCVLWATGFLVKQAGRKPTPAACLVSTSIKSVWGRNQPYILEDLCTNPLPSSS